MAQITYYIKEAKKLGIDIQKVGSTPYYLMTNGRKKVYFDDGFTSELTSTGFIGTVHKQITKKFLQLADIQTPKWVEFYEASTTSDIRKYADQLQYPVVIKPERGTHGRNITVGITTIAKTVPLVKELQKMTKVILVEEMFHGTEIRLLATRNKFLGAIWRRPASLLGDGKQTIAQLVKAKNSQSKRTRHQPNLYPLLLDADALQVLKKQGFTSKSRPAKNTRVYTRSVSNLAAGGDSIDVTDKIHPSVKKIAVAAVQAIPGLPFAGLDFMTKDYTIQQTPKTYTVIEINSNPMVGMHHKPFLGRARNVTREILLEFFPQSRRANNKSK